MKTCYLFDFDGTLVDSMPTFVSCMLRILDDNHISYGSELTKIITPLGVSGTADYFINTLGLAMEKLPLIDLMKKYMLDAYYYKIPAKPHVTAVLHALKQRGDSLNILTASPHITLDACLKRLGLWELFDHVFSCDDFCTTKADPQIYRKAAEKLCLPVEQILFLDDNLDANTTAKSAGMLTCGVYDPSSDAYVAQMQAVTDYYIYDFSQLPDIDIHKKA